MTVEVPPHVQEILGPYPELVEQWKAKMARPCILLANCHSFWSALSR
jgi:hypothetical protein